MDETNFVFDGSGGGGQKNNSAKIDWVDLDQKTNFSAAHFFRLGGLCMGWAVLSIPYEGYAYWQFLQYSR